MGIVMDTETVCKRVRASDPVSSIEAAENASRFARSHCVQIISALEQHEGLTADEIADMTGLTVVQIDRRLPELARAGKARVLQHDGLDMIRNGYRVWGIV